MGACELSRMLVEPDDVSAGVTEARCDLRRVGPDGLDDFAAVGDDGLDRSGHAVHVNIEQESGRCAGRTPKHPRTAYRADRVVKRSAAVTAFPDVPVEDLFVKVGRACNVRSGHFEIADFAVRHGRHESSFWGKGIIAGKYTVRAARKFLRDRDARGRHYPEMWNWPKTNFARMAPPRTAIEKLRSVPIRKYSAKCSDLNSGYRAIALAARMRPAVPGDCSSRAVRSKKRSSQPMYRPAFCMGPLRLSD